MERSLVIGNDKIYTENWNRALKYGKIDPKNFTPYPKNPIIARFFVNIGLSDQLGSGVRNLYKYTKIYSGQEPELIEGDVFKTVIPLSLSLTNMSDKTSDKLTPSENKFFKKVSSYLETHEFINASTAGKIYDKSPATARRLLKKLVTVGFLIAEGENKNRIYKTVKL